MKKMAIAIAAFISLIILPGNGIASLSSTGTLNFSWNTADSIPVKSIGGYDAYYEYDHRYNHGYANGTSNYEQYRGPGTSPFYQYYYFDTSGSGVGPTVNETTSSLEANSSASSEWQLNSPGSTRSMTQFTNGSGHILSQSIASRNPTNEWDRAENFTNLSGIQFSFTPDPSNTDDWVISLFLDLDSIIEGLGGAAGSYLNKTEFTVTQYLNLDNANWDRSRHTQYCVRDFRHDSTDSDQLIFDFHINPYSQNFDYQDELDDNFNPNSANFQLQFRAYSSAYEKGSPVPVPSTIFLLATGLISITGLSRRKK